MTERKYTANINFRNLAVTERKFDHVTQADLINRRRGLEAIGFHFAGIGVMAKRTESEMCEARLLMSSVADAIRVLTHNQRISG